jgi:fatty acid desaturase
MGDMAKLPRQTGLRMSGLARLSSRVKLAIMDAIDHRTAITNLEPALRSSLIERKDGPGMLRFGFHLGAIIALGTLIALRAPFWFLLLPVQGILIVFLFTALHECIHETAFKSSFLNTAISSISGFLILIPPVWFRFFHFAHHRHTHDPARDPELLTPKPSTVIGYVKHVSGLPLWFSAIRTLLRNATGRGAEDYVPEKAKARVSAEARVMLALYALLAVASVFWQSPLMIWTWIVPALLGQPFLRLFLLAEHTNCPHVDNMFENTRTTFTTKLVRLVAWNMPFHAEHHALPTVPFHKLPELHEAVRAHLKTTADGYARFNGDLVADLSKTNS